MDPIDKKNFPKIMFLENTNSVCKINLFVSAWH